MSFFVYILASRRNGTLYTGMTDNLVGRVWQHQARLVPGFTKTYGVKTLVWFEVHETREAAILRERQLKKWNRAWKLELIERGNPAWRGPRFRGDEREGTFAASLRLRCYYSFVPAKAGTQGKRQ